MEKQKILVDSKAIQLKVGLEVHQQLATNTKLFCTCPPYSGEDSSNAINDSEESLQYEFRRKLRPVTSELGELDVAARFESRRETNVRYLVNRATSCLVEADEEPPHPISEDAIDTALLFALALDSHIADEIHVMRKIVVDGSNTSGFQRTAVISLGGKLTYNEGKRSVGVQSISLEEDAARAVEGKNARLSATRYGKDERQADERTYALDRLGTPLVEVALSPIEGEIEEIEDAAKTLGRMMRSTGRIARGLGTIRQDLNISVMNGNVIEVKGVQRLDQIGKVVLHESARQKFFFDLATELREKIGHEIEVVSSEVTEIFRETDSGILKKALGNPDSIVQCLLVKDFAGYFGRENALRSRLGKELGSIAKSYGLGGVFHSDELPNYGITLDELALLRNDIGAAPDDGFVLIAGARKNAVKASEAIASRIKHVTSGVPAETRAASLEGETTFLRPRPGSARMYPETDIPLIPVPKERLDSLRKQIPETWEVQVRKFAKKYDLPDQLAEPLFDSENKSIFENVVSSTKLPPRYTASVLVDIYQSLERDNVDVLSLSPEVVTGMFLALDRGEFAKEAVPGVLRILGTEHTLTLEQALSKSGLVALSKDELKKIVEQTIRENESLVKARGKQASQGTLMGKVMQKVRGKADGKLVSEMVASCLASYEVEEKVNE